MEITESGGNYRGTGVLLNDRWVLTAAHNWDAGAVTQLAFSINGQRHQVADCIQHPGWDGNFSPMQGWDVRLVRLAQPVVGFVSWGVNPTEPGNLYGSGYGDAGYLMRTSGLNGWITSMIPEPSTAVLTIAGLVVELRRRRWRW